jgi:hypothetical protein
MMETSQTCLIIDNGFSIYKLFVDDGCSIDHLASIYKCDRVVVESIIRLVSIALTSSSVKCDEQL